MKTNITLNHCKTIITYLALMAFIMMNKPTAAQGPSMGLMLKNSVSGAGLGSVISPQLYYKNNKHQFSLGVNIQKKHLNVCGLKAGYNFILNPGDQHEVFLFCDVASFNNAYLGNNTIKQESFISPENAGYFQSARINVIEQHIGFGVNFFKTGPVSFFGAIGAGVYKTIGVPQLSQFKNRDLVDASVMLNVGVSFKLIQKK